MAFRFLSDLAGTLLNSFRIKPAAVGGAPTSGAHAIGEIYMDSTGKPWRCVAAGTPGSWKPVDMSEEAFDSSKDPTGFVDPANITVAYDHVARTITLTHASGYVDYAWRGQIKRLTSPWVSSAHTNALGSYYLSSTDGVNFTWSTTPWSFFQIMVAFCRFDPTNSVYYAYREVHGLMPWTVHEELHQVVGTRYMSGGTLTAGTYRVDPSAPIVDADNRPGVDAALIADEDLQSTIAAMAENGPYSVLYFTSAGVPVFTTAASDIYVQSGGIIQCNPVGIGLQSVSNTNFVNATCYLMPVANGSESIKYRMIWLVGQAQYTSLALAQAEVWQSNGFGLISNSLAEIVPYARVTFQYKSSLSTVGKCEIMGVQYLTGTRASTGSGGGGGAGIADAPATYDHVRTLGAWRAVTDQFNNTKLGADAGLVSTNNLNVFFGYKSGEKLVAGSSNCFVGSWSGNGNVNGNSNTAIGASAMEMSTASNNQVAVGTNAMLRSNGSSNTGVGYIVATYLTTGENNTMVGHRALANANASITSRITAIGSLAMLDAYGNDCVGVGYNALASGSNKTDNTAVGSQAGQTPSGNHITCIGRNAGTQAADGSTFVGSGAGYQAGGSYNVGVGYQAHGYGGGYDNVAVGASALPNSSFSGAGDVAVGRGAGFSATSVNNSTFVGYHAGYAPTNTGQNTAIGSLAMAGGGAGPNNGSVAVGYKALNDSMGNSSVAIGAEAIGGNNRANLDFCVAIGWQAMYTPGANNIGDIIAIGREALKVVAAPQCVAIGGGSQQTTTSGGYNVSLGHNTLNGLTTGNSNTALGHQAGVSENRNGCTYLGKYSSCTGDDQIQLGGSGSTPYAYASLQIRSDARDKTDIQPDSLGLDFLELIPVRSWRWNMREDYRTITPRVVAPPRVEERTVKKEVSPAKLVLEEYRDEAGVTQYRTVLKEAVYEDVVELVNIPAVEEFDVVFDADAHAAASKARSRRHRGVIAQELKAVMDANGIDFAGFQHHSVKGGDDVMTVSMESFVPVLIKAVQELSARVKQLEARS